MGMRGGRGATTSENHSEKTRKHAEQLRKQIGNIFKKHENYIVGWVLNDDNTYCEIILGEKEEAKGEKDIDRERPRQIKRYTKRDRETDQER